MIHWRLQRLSAKAWSHTQYGFRKDSWTMDAVFIVKRLMEAFRTTRHVRRGTEFEEHQRTLYLMFEDFVKAFDSVPRELLWKELTQIFQVPEAFVELLKKFHVGFKTYTVFNGVFNKGFTTTSGVRQGCITGPDLWNFHFQVVIWAFARRVARKPNIRAGGGITYYCDGRFRTRAECKGQPRASSKTSRAPRRLQVLPCLWTIHKQGSQVKPNCSVSRAATQNGNLGTTRMSNRLAPGGYLFRSCGSFCT